VLIKIFLKIKNHIFTFYIFLYLLIYGKNHQKKLGKNVIFYINFHLKKTFKMHM